MRPELKTNLLVFGVVVVLFVILAAGPLEFELSGVLALLLILFCYFGLADARVVQRLKQFQSRGWIHQAMPLLALFLLFAAYAAPASRLSPLETALLAAYLILPLMMIGLDQSIRPEKISLSFPLAAAILILWLPLELGFLHGVRLPRSGGVPLIFPLAVVAAFYLFRIVRDLNRIGLTFRFSRSDWQTAAAFFGLYLSFFALPLAVSLDFAQSAIPTQPPAAWALRALVIFFFTALPEELLFRGLIHNLLERTLPAPWMALAISSVVFGLAHLNNLQPPLLAVQLAPGLFVNVPWVYWILATIAGFFYGWVYMKTRKITVSAIVHTLVNTWWAVFFTSRSV